MKIKLYNSLSKTIEDFQPNNANTVSVYSCGPTVYNYAHIGNLRAFLFPDLLQRVLKTVGGYEVKWVMNITDIDDKTIRDSKIGSTEWKPEFGEQTGDSFQNLMKLTEFYTNELINDFKAIKIKTKDFYELPRATKYIPSMQDLVLKIIKNGYGYVSGGSVYFNVMKWSQADKYGKLKNIDFDNFRATERVENDEYDKEEAMDFVMWKGKKDDEPYWDFIIDGVNYPGRPGWHLECSAMCESILGLPFDIHTGGIDLKFPHHEDEIAQGKAGYGVEPATFWCHNAFLEVEGKKMSKSLNNFFTLKDLLDKGINPLDIRFAMLSSHYRSIYNFTFDDLNSAKKGRERIQDFIYSLLENEYGNDTIEVEKIREEVWSNLSNDLHTPKALASIFSFINNNKNSKFDEKTNNELVNFFKEVNSIFNVFEFENKEKIEYKIPDEVKELANLRFEAKNSKNWAEADRLRTLLTEKGYSVKDTKDGYEIGRNG